MQRIPPRKFIPPDLGATAHAGAACVANVIAAVEQVRANRSGTAAGGDPEYLHQLRVGLRRLRATLRAFRALARRDAATRFDRRLRDELRALGPARDWDVFADAFASPALRREAQLRGEPARRRARAAAKSARLRFLPEEVLAWAQGRPWRKRANPHEPILAFARRELERVRGRLVKEGDAIDWQDAPRRHQVRIRVKRLRYSCECLAAAWGTQAMQPYLKSLRRLQEILGELNDIDVQRRLLQEIATSDRAWRSAAAAARTLAQRERVLLGRLRRAWRAFESAEPYWRAPAAAPAAA